MISHAITAFDLSTWECFFSLQNAFARLQSWQSCLVGSRAMLCPSILRWFPFESSKHLGFFFRCSCFYEVLADYWQAMTLADAAAKCWYKLPIVHQLEAGYPWLSILTGMLVLWFLAGRNAPSFCWLIEIGYFFVYHMVIWLIPSLPPL